jgi:hypothetical protein
MLRGAAPSASVAPMTMRAIGSPPLPLLSHHEYFLLRSSMLMAFLLGFSFSGSRSASFSIIWPTRSPTHSIAASTQLKGDMASWNRVPHKAVITHSQHPLYLTIRITRIKMVTFSLNAPQTNNISDRKKIMGPITLYKGKKLDPTMSMREPCAAELNASPHSPFSERPT